MAHTIAPNVILNETNNLVINVCVVGDGASGELSAAQFLDISEYTDGDVKVMAMKTALVNFSAQLFWGADTNVHMLSAPSYKFVEDYAHFGGITNNAGAGKTGDILITTYGLSGQSYEGHIILEMEKE